jgi:uncharacterized protein YjbJ (UPF0337 family)
MNESTKDQLEGMMHELSGAAKEAVGHIVGNPNLEADGLAEKLTGKVQSKVGQVERVLEK